MTASLDDLRADPDPEIRALWRRRAAGLELALAIHRENVRGFPLMADLDPELDAFYAAAEALAATTLELVRMRYPMPAGLDEELREYLAAGGGS